MSDYESFKAWKIGMAKRCLARARAQRLAGYPAGRGYAAAQINGSAQCRQSLVA